MTFRLFTSQVVQRAWPLGTSTWIWAIGLQRVKTDKSNVCFIKMEI